MDPDEKPSFSAYRKWGVGFQLVLLIVVVLAVVVMVNVVSHDYFTRVHVSARTRYQLSPRTLSLLQSITNQVKVVLYYDKKDPLYGMVSDLLGEYSRRNSNLSIQSVDYLRDAAAAQKIKADYKLNSGNDKNVIVFDCGGKSQRIDGGAIAQYTLEQVPSEKEREYRRKPVAFLGETLFTAALLNVTNPKPLKSYYLQGHGEHQLDSGEELTGYVNFSGVLRQNHMRVEGLSLLGTNAVPPDCDMLVVAGPTESIPEMELGKIEQYLAQGGRLLALFRYQPVRKDTGLEKVLAKWGIDVGSNVIVDPEHSSTTSGADVIVSAFSKHPLVNPILGSGIFLTQPRTIGKLAGRAQPADAARVEEIAFTGANSSLLLAASPQSKRTPVGYPVMVAAEKGAIKGVTGGSTRILVIGDSFLFANNQLELLSNRDLATYVASWLTERGQLLSGVGPRPIKDYRLVMTRSQLQSARWILLAGMPGVVLLVGGLAMARRRR